MDGSLGDPDLADEIWRWDTALNQYQLAYLFDSGGAIPTYDGQWFDQITAMPSTMDLSLGKGFWARNKWTTADTIDFDGLVQRTSYQIPVVVDGVATKLHHMGQPMAADVALTEAGTSFWSDGALGSLGDPDAADEIWAWLQSGDQYWFNYLFDSAGMIPTYDGEWFDQVTAMPTTMSLDAGLGWWYRSKADAARAGDPSWYWTEPVPY